VAGSVEKREISAVRVGARRSNLSLVQVKFVEHLLRATYPTLNIDIEEFTTSGDHQIDTPLPIIGGKGVFTEELEEALLSGRIDLAVHSLKDLPTAHRDGLTIGAVPERASAADVVVSRHGVPLRGLPSGAVVGTSSLRRGAQILRHRSDLRIQSIRGNVETRLRKVIEPDGGYEAIVLAAAGLERLALSNNVTETLPLDVMLPAPGQGALAVQCRDEPAMHAFLAPIHHLPTALTTTAERAFLSGLGGGCSAPVAAYATLEGDRLEVRGRVTSVDGSEQVDVQLAIPCSTETEADAAGRRLADEALAQGATQLLGVTP